MKQYTILLPEELWEDFVRAVPAHGVRAALLRAFIRKIVSLHKHKGVHWDELAVRQIWKLEV